MRMRMLFLEVMVLASVVAVPGTASGESIRVVTWNIEHLGSPGRGLGGIGAGTLPLRSEAQLKAIATFITNDLNADVVALQEVAIKVAKSSEHDDSRRERRRRKLFFNEAKAAALLKHPNIVVTIDAGIDGERRYIVMEYVPGARTLGDYCDPRAKGVYRDRL